MRGWLSSAPHLLSALSGLFALHCLSCPVLSCPVLPSPALFALPACILPAASGIPGHADFCFLKSENWLHFAVLYGFWHPKTLFCSQETKLSSELMSGNKFLKG